MTATTADDELRRALDKAFAAASPQQALQILDDVRARFAAVDDVFAYHHARARIFVVVGRFDDAVAAADRAVDLEPGIPDLATNLGAALLGRFRQKGDRADLVRARDVLQTAVSVGVRTPEVRATLAIALEQLGDAAGALAACDDNLAQFPGDAPTLFNRAAALRALGRAEEAKQQLTTLAKTFPPAQEALARWR